MRSAFSHTADLTPNTRFATFLLHSRVAARFTQATAPALQLETKCIDTSTGPCRLLVQPQRALELELYPYIPSSNVASRVARCRVWYK